MTDTQLTTEQWDAIWTMVQSIRAMQVEITTDTLEAVVNATNAAADMGVPEDFIEIMAHGARMA